MQSLSKKEICKKEINLEILLGINMQGIHQRI